MTVRPPLPAGPFLVLGLARAGQAAVTALARIAGPDQIRAWDGDTGPAMQRLGRELESAGVHTELGPQPRDASLRWAGTVIKSPGISPASPAIQRARAHGREFVDELEIGWRLTQAPVLAVTGTNGKSTVCGLAQAALSAAGHRVCLAGNTQFGSPLSAVAPDSLDWIVCEVSSFQLEGCTRLLPDLAVLTNLTRAHLDRHGSLDRYAELKRRLFIRHGEVVARAVIDVDGTFGRSLAAELSRHGASVATVGFAADADYRIRAATWDLRRALTSISTPAGSITLASRLPGAHNAHNIATALAIADDLGVPRGVTEAVVRDFPGVPGRFEHIDAGQPFPVIVDLANTPDALGHLLRSIRAAIDSGGRLIVVFGRGGTPTPIFAEMGQLMAELADRLILTTSGFRGAPALPALELQLKGARTVPRASLEVVLDRRDAIRRGVRVARAGDVLVIPGRGAWGEMRWDPHGTAIRFDDRCVTREILREGRVASSRPEIVDGSG